MNKIYEFKNQGVRNRNSYYLIDETTIEIEIKNNKSEIKRCIIDKEDFEKVKCCNWNFRKDSKTFYVYNSRFGMIHRLIMDCPQDMQIDHINGNGLDNRKSNLKIVTSKQNAHNLHHAKGKNEIVGVILEEGKHPRYRAFWNEDGKQKSKSFSIAKYGEQAKDMAIEFRKAIEDTLYKDIYNDNKLPTVTDGQSIINMK